MHLPSLSASQVDLFPSVLLYSCSAHSQSSLIHPCLFIRKSLQVQAFKMKHQLHGIQALRVQKLLDILQRWTGASSDPVTSAGDAGMDVRHWQGSCNHKPTFSTQLAGQSPTWPVRSRPLHHPCSSSSLIFISSSPASKDSYQEAALENVAWHLLFVNSEGKDLFARITTPLPPYHTQYQFNLVHSY